MVSLRSQDQPAAAAAETGARQSKQTSSVMSGKTARRSMTPDRVSQDSVLRRSQRVRDRQQALESIQEDTAASGGTIAPEDSQKISSVCNGWYNSYSSCVVAEAKPALERSTQATAQFALERATQAAAHPAELATISRGATAEGAVPEPVTKPAAVSRAQAVQDAILHASDASSSDSAADSNNSDSEAESNVDILAQLSESMWASLRSDAHTNACAPEPAKARRDAAQFDSLRKAQPKGLQAVNQDTEVGKLQRVQKLCCPWDKGCLCVLLLY